MYGKIVISVLLAVMLFGGVAMGVGERTSPREWEEVEAMGAGTTYTVTTGEMRGATTSYKEMGLHLREGTPVDGEPYACVIHYTNTTMATEGWNYLDVFTGSSVTQQVAVWTAGFFEGLLTADMIYDSWRNTMKGYCKWQGEEYCNHLRNYVYKNYIWTSKMITDNPDDPYWNQVELVLLQMQALMEGYKASGYPAIRQEEIMWMNMMGDLEDLSQALKYKNNMTTGTDTLPSVRGDGHCSALVKLLPGNTDLYASHVTWNSLQSMLRLQKRYTLLFTDKNGELIPGYSATFSSYPGIIHSADDYYALSSGLLSMETTIGNSNPDLWVHVKPERQVQEWIRVVVANRLATDGESWTKIFSAFNSGTYNNQWMVVDYKLFTPFSPLRPNTLWVSEQLPGLIISRDVTQKLQQDTYWASYNSPAFPEIFNASGLPALVKKYGDWFSHDKTPRARIFARDHGKVKDMGSMIRLMRYNNYKKDPLSACDCSPPYSGENGISGRSDLNPANGTYAFGALGHRSHAGTDMKVTSLNLMRKNQFLAVAGPTYDDLPGFAWSTSDFEKDTPHFGHPNSFMFDVVNHDWPF